MIKDYFDEQLGTSKDTNSGETRYLCPFCHEDSFKFYVNTDTNSSKYGLWECKHCKQAGNFIQFIMKTNRVNYSSARDIAFNYDFNDSGKSYINEITLSENLLLSLNGLAKGSSSDNISSLASASQKLLPTLFSPKFLHLKDNFGKLNASPYLDYCHKRGFTKQDIINYDICYCPYAKIMDGNTYLTSIYKSLVFITKDFNGTPVYWNTRSIVPSKVKAKNAPEIEGHISKRNAVFNLDQAYKCPYVILTEGVPDAITLGKPAVATFGKAVSDDQIDLIVNSISQETPIILLLDMDAKNIMISLATRIALKHPNVYMVNNPTNRDANSLGKDEMYNIIQNNLIKYTEKSAICFGL